MTPKVLSLLNVTRILAVAALAAGMVGGRLLADGPSRPASSQSQQPSISQSRNSSQNGRGRGTPGEVRPWWKDARMVSELGLTPMQVDKINTIYERRQRAIKPAIDELQLMRADLDRVLKEKKAKPAEIEALARRLTYPHLEIDISRIRMLYEMSLVLKPEQQIKFDQLDERRQRAQGQGPRGNSTPR